MTSGSLHAALVRLGTQGFPTSAYFELTHRCNASCDYCYVRHSPKPDLPTGKILEVIDILSENGILSIHFTGGEPFVRSDIEEILAHAVRRDFFYMTILTNAAAFSPSHLEFLCTHAGHFKAVQISVFSHVPAVNDRILGVSGAMERMIEAGKRLMSAGIALKLSLSPREATVDHIQDTVDFYERLGFGVNLSATRIFCSAVGPPYLENETTYGFYTRLFSGFTDAYLRRFLNSLQKAKSKQPRHDLCSGRFCTVTVDPQGGIYPCVSFRNYRLGNIFEERDLAALYSSEKMKAVQALSIKDYPGCDGCRYANFCSLCIGAWHTRFGSFGVADRQLCNFAAALSGVLHERGIG
jgi:radical SAM protein with 4Fe4S-binding SPASM domain